MKRPEICLLILVILFANSLGACSPGGPSYGPENCSSGGEVCITLQPVEPINFGEPVTVTINVTSTKEIPELSVSLQTEGTVDGPLNWENYLSYKLVSPGIGIWNFAIKAGQTLTFTRVVNFPAKEGYYDIVAQVVNVGRTVRGIDFFIIHMAPEAQGGGLIYREGTKIPHFTPNVTVVFYGPGTPYPTFLPTYTISATLTHIPAANTQIPPLATSTPTPIQIMPFVATSTRPPYPGSTPYP